MGLLYCGVVPVATNDFESAAAPVGRAHRRIHVLVKPLFLAKHTSHEINLRFATSVSALAENQRPSAVLLYKAKYLLLKLQHGSG